MTLTLSRHVDLPSVREGIKAGFNARIAGGMAENSAGDPLAAAGAALAGAMVGPMVDLLVTPQGLVMMMNAERPRPGNNDRNFGAALPRTESETEAVLRYEDFNHFVMAVRKKANNEGLIGLVLRRDGAVTWKLAALRLSL